MFFIRTTGQGRGQACFVLWYKDPVHLQEERRPPSVNALDELRNMGNGLQAVEMMLMWQEQGKIKLNRGIVQYDCEKLYFDDEDGSRSSLEYPESFVSQNKILLSLNEQKHEYFTKFRVPVLSTTEIHFKEISELDILSDVWLGALVVSRAKITLFMIWNIVKDYPYNQNPFTMEFQEHPQRATESREISTNFLLFVPTAKPISLQEFLDRASESQISEKESMDMLERSFPLYEGYYGVHVHRIRPNVEDNFHHAAIRFDDYGGTKTNELWHGRIDFGRADTTIEKIGVSEETDRGYLSLDMPTLLNSEHSKTSSTGYGDWGFTGCIENTEVFMVPYLMRDVELFEENRSKMALKNIRRRIFSRNKHVYSSLMLSSVDNKYKLIFSAPDCEHILNSLKNGTALNPSKIQRDSWSPSKSAPSSQKKRLRSSASSPEDFTLLDDPGLRTENAKCSLPKIGSPRRKKIKHSIAEGLSRKTDSQTGKISSENERMENSSPKHTSSLESQVPDRDQQCEIEEDAISPQIDQDSCLKAAENQERSAEAPRTPPHFAEQPDINAFVQNLQVEESRAAMPFSVKLRLRLHTPSHEPAPAKEEESYINVGKEKMDAIITEDPPNDHDTLGNSSLIPRHDQQPSASARSLEPYSPSFPQYPRLQHEHSALEQQSAPASTPQLSASVSVLSPQDPSTSHDNFGSLMYSIPEQQAEYSAGFPISPSADQFEDQTGVQSSSRGEPSPAANIKDKDDYDKESNDESVWINTTDDLNIETISAAEFQSSLESFTQRNYSYQTTSTSIALIKRAVELTSNSNRSIMKPETLPAAVEGFDLLEFPSEGDFFGAWSDRGEFREGSRVKIQWWLEKKIFTPQTTRRDEMDASFDCWNDYRRYCMFMALYLTFVELLDLSSRDRTWSFDAKNAPREVSGDYMSSALLKSLDRDPHTKCQTITIEKTLPRLSSSEHCRIHDVVCVDILVPDIHGARLMFSAFGVVTSQDVSPIKPLKEEETCESYISVLGWSREYYKTSTEVVSRSKFASVRRIGYVGSTMRAFEAVRSMIDFPTDVRTLLLGKERMKEPSKIGNQIRSAARNGRGEYEAAVLRSLWFLRDGPPDYISRMTVLQDESLSSENEEFGCLNAGQGAAIAETVSALPFLEKSHLSSRTVCVVGPAGTGKTNTLVHCIAAIGSVAKIRKKLLQGEMLRAHVQSQNAMDDVVLKKEFIPLRDEGAILCVCPTNSAVDVIEHKLQSGIPVRAEDGSLKRVYPLYERVTPSYSIGDNSVNAQRGRKLKRNFKRLFSGMGHENRSGWIVLTTFGSLYRVFTSKKNRPVFSAIFVDEASQVSDLDYIILFENLSRPSSDIPHNYVLSIYGDPLQQPPVVKGRPTRYSNLYSLSLLERMIPRMSGANIRGEDQVSNVTLGMQYRMNPVISALSNRIANREVQSDPCTSGRSVIEPQGATSVYYTALTAKDRTNLRRQLLAHPFVFLDPYREQGLSYQEPFSREQSHREAIIVSRIIKTVSMEPTLRDDDIIVLSVYAKQLKCLKEVVGRELQQSRGEIEISNNIKFSTIAGVQGAEAKVVIFSATRRRRNLSTGVRCGDGIGLVGDLKTIYVMVTRASCHLYIVGDAELLSVCSNHWKKILDFARSN